MMENSFPRRKDGYRHNLGEHGQPCGLSQEHRLTLILVTLILVPSRVEKEEEKGTLTYL